MKIWAAARHSDLESLSPSSLSISQGGLGGSFLPIFVAKDAFFLRPDWQTMGMSLWKAEEINFESDFFLPFFCNRIFLVAAVIWPLTAMWYLYPSSCGDACAFQLCRKASGFSLIRFCSHLRTQCPSGRHIQSAIGWFPSWQQPVCLANSGS